jgi:hypothetical protein
MELQIFQLYNNKYFDNILVYHNDRNNADNIYDDKITIRVLNHHY